jgi:hypothetical protein
MRRIAALVILVCSISFVKAQTFELVGGATFATVLPNTLNLAYEENYSMNIGFNAGINVSFPISRIFSIKTGLLWDSKGFKQSGYELLSPENVFLLFKSNIQARLYYIDLPVLLRESYILNDKSFIFTELGGYVGLGINGKFNFNYQAVVSSQTITRENKVYWGDDLNRLDYGLSFGLGYQLYAIQLLMAYDLGLANILADVNSDRTFKNRAFRVSLVYVINGNNKKKYLKNQLQQNPLN